LVTTLQKDTEVQVLETGSSTTIDGITAPWVKILSSTGYTGWCFSGYLEELPKVEVLSTQTETTETENVVVTSSQDNAIPFYLIFGGIAIVAIAGVVVFLLLRKRGA
jgi:hypothetical protein